MRKLLFLIMLLMSSAPIWAEDILIPVDEDPENPPREHRKRSRPMMQWCTIDTDARTVTTTLSLPVLTYYILDEDDAVVVASDSAADFAGSVAALPEGVYTLRLVTAESAYLGPLTIE